jgi:TolB-like protein/Tfp pilus assembly protein PilF
MATLSSPMRQEQIRLPSHVIDLAADELRRATGEHVDLRPRSFAVLRVLAENVGSLVTKDEIIAKVWDDAAVTEDSLTQCIAEIRKAIGDEERRILRTVPRRGYTLTSSDQKELAAPVRYRPTLAVLPFRSLSGNKETSLALGVASELLNELARNRDLRLIGRDSSFALGGQPAKAQELGEQLGARYLVEGTAKRSKDEIVVDVQLVDAREGIVVWGNSFSAKAVDIPRTQRLIANQIAASVRVSMHETEKYIVLGRAPRDLDVYQLTLRAMSEHRFTPEATRASRQDLEEATRRDPNYALAWTQLAWVNMLDAWIQLTDEWHLSQLDEVIEQFSRAIDLDPNLSKAYRGLGQAMILKGDIAQALTVSRRGFELGPSEPDSLLFYGIALFESGELAEATKKIEQALALHPLRPSYYSYFHAIILWANERFEEALTEIETVLQRAPLFDAEVYRALALVGLGRTAEAKDQIAKYEARPRRPPVLPPHPPALARRFLEDLHTAGWRPSLAAHQKAV